MTKLLDKTWKEFQRNYPGHVWLDEDPLYALTEATIDAIKAYIPGFFTEQQEQFERELVRRTGAGFYLRRPLGPPMAIGQFLLNQQVAGSDDIDRRLAPTLKPEGFSGGNARQSIRLINDFLVHFWTTAGRSAKEIQQALRQQQTENELRERRGEAYAGWLVCHQPFQQELAKLREAWGPTITHRGGFPKPANTAVGVGTSRPRKSRDGCTKACFEFYRRWCLERMLTWELPAPLEALHLPSNIEGRETISTEGVTLFLPWYLLRGGQFDLQQVVERIRFESTPAHLLGWVQKQSEGRENQTGEISYQRRYWLYRCNQLVLFRRYQQACAKNIERLDRAMASVMERDEDWVKRLRQRLTRELKSAAGNPSTAVAEEQ